VIIAAAVVGAEAGHAGLPGGRSSPAIIRRG
jgi:hypothetical protein